MFQYSFLLETVQYSVFTLGSTVLLWRLYLIQYSYLLETLYCTVQYYSGDFILYNIVILWRLYIVQYSVLGSTVLLWGLNLVQYSFLLETLYCTVQYYSGDFILYNIVILRRLYIVQYSVLGSTVLLWRLYLVQYSYLMETWYCTVQCLYLGQYTTTLGTLSCTIQLSYGDLILYSTVIFWRPNIVQYSVFTLGSTVIF